MLHFWGKHNKITTSALQVQYASTRMGYGATYSIMEWHRIATKEYSYIGMDEMTAKKCMEAKLEQYTRLFVQDLNARGQWIIPAKRERRCVADVSMRHDAAEMWCVDIKVNEDQVQYVLQYHQLVQNIPTDKFDLTFDYDEDDPDGVYLRISRVYRENARLYVAYEQEIKNFSRMAADFHVERRASNGSAWTAMTPTSHQDGLMYFNSGSWSDGYIRLRWGDNILSNEEGTPDAERTRALVLSGLEYQNSGGWTMKYTQDFALFNPLLVVLWKAGTDGVWSEVDTNYIVKANGEIILDIQDHETVQKFKATFDGVTSNVLTTLPVQIIVKSDLFATVENNTVTTCAMTFYPHLEDYSDSNVSIKYSDSHGTRTIENANITIAQGDGVSRIATFSVGNVILGNSMVVSATLLYEGMEGAKATATVTRT